MVPGDARAVPILPEPGAKGQDIPAGRIQHQREYFKKIDFFPVNMEIVVCVACGRWRSAERNVKELKSKH